MRSEKEAMEERNEKRESGDGTKAKVRYIGNGMEEFKIAFWNVAGLENKDVEFWESIRKWDIVMMLEI